jgi:hypothetical protein
MVGFWVGPAIGPARDGPVLALARAVALRDARD